MPDPLVRSEALLVDAAGLQFDVANQVIGADLAAIDAASFVNVAQQLIRGASNCQIDFAHDVFL